MIETLREVHETIYLKSVRGLKPINNNVLCKRVYNNIKDQTKGGLWKVAESYNRDQFLTQNAERIYEVAARPEFLNKKNTPWETDVEIREGDKIIVVFHPTLKANVIIDDNGDEYRFIPYHSIIAKINNDKLEPINGYIIFTPVYEKIETSLHSEFIKPKIDYTQGKIAFLSNPNKQYYLNNEQDYDRSDYGIDIKIGDTVKFLLKHNLYAIKLEDELHRKLDEEYYCCHRHRIATVIKNE